MRVAVDGRSQRAGRAPRGIAVYLDLLLPELAAGGDELEVIRERGRLAYASAALLRRPRLDRIAGGCDVVWAPAPAPLAVSRGVPLVMTVHDLSFEHRPRDYTPYERLWHVLARPRALARRAARLIAVSHAVRDQLLDEWGLPEEKVVAIPSGPGRPRTPPQTPGEPLPASYFLAVGAIEPRKRVDLLLEAHAAARREGLQASLVLAGDGRLAERARAAGAEVLGFVPDAELEAAYAGALALVSASREEGFGFPPLEALARAVPAVVPDLPPFRETLGDAALRYPEADVGRFSWKEAARRTGEVLREAAA